jgi:HSP20 family protein
MSLIRHNNTNDQALATRDFDPFRWMRDALRWDPFQLQTTMPSWTGPSFERTFTPAFEVKETKENFLFKADLPGMKEADIEIKLTGNRLAISGKREAMHEDKADTYYTFERAFGSFQRTFVLPDGLDTEHVQAELKDGVLTVALPKKATAQTKTIAIKAGDRAKS